jgi:hypothetical protein
MKKWVLFLFISLLFFCCSVLPAYAQDKAFNFSQAIIDLIAYQIESSKSDYPALLDFDASKAVQEQKDGMWSLEHSGKEVQLKLFFSGVYNARKNKDKINYIFYIEETGSYLWCNLSADGETFNRLEGMLKSIPGIKGCSVNEITGDWDQCEYLI